MAPDSGAHSVIESPESVSRVSPPTTIITATSAKRSISQTRTAPRAPRRPASIMPPWGADGLGFSPTSSKMLRFWLMRRPVPFPVS